MPHNRDIVAVMITCNRAPSRNYLSATLSSMLQSDLLTSERLAYFAVSSQPGSGAFARETIAPFKRPSINLFTYAPTFAVTPNEHVANALRNAWQQSQDLLLGEKLWIVFLEDDIAVGPQFFDSIGAWLDDHACDDRYKLYPLASMRPEVLECVVNERTCCEVPILGFYGTQGFAVRAHLALHLADYINDNVYTLNQPNDNPRGVCWDLLIQKWAIEHWPDTQYFLTPSPSYLQHTGCESVVSPRPNTHAFPSFAPSYSYIQHRIQLESTHV